MLRAIEGGLLDDLLPAWRAFEVKGAVDASSTAYARLLALVDRSPGPSSPTPKGALERAPYEWYGLGWQAVRDAISTRLYGPPQPRGGVVAK